MWQPRSEKHLRPQRAEFIGATKMTKYYRIESARMEAISEKARGLTRWLVENAPYCESSQKHLDAGTVEQAYWHYGYVCAIRDVIAIATSDSAQ
jgi:hypothetical protein